MSVNSSSASILIFNYCFISGAAVKISIAVSVVKTILILPLCILVLYLGYRQWRQQRSLNTTSHSDIFTYHMAVMQLIWFLGCVCNFFGVFTNCLEMIVVGFWTNFIVFYGEIFFHLLTCMERYLAVVHPITYLGLKNARGVRIRNISTGCVWLLCVGLVGFVYLPHSAILFFCFLTISLIIVSFCSISVLCALIRPGPGEGRGERERVDQSKRRAFQTTKAITGVLWLWFLGVLVTVALMTSAQLSPSTLCVVISSTGWLTLPSSSVLPLLYLHRAGKLPCFWCNNE